LKYLDVAYGPEVLAKITPTVRFETEMTVEEMVELAQYLSEMGFGEKG